MDENEIEDAPAATKDVHAWASAKGTDPFLLAGALGRERAAGRWTLHTAPVATEAEFDAAIAAFKNLQLG